MNSLIWGTCNTNTPYAQCKANMGWFASTLGTQCTDELTGKNSLVVNTLTALQAFEVMHDAACLEDPTTDTYCYLNAVRASKPSDLYYYNLPLGVKLPKTVAPSCSSCTKSVMALYASTLKNSSKSTSLTGLKTTYDSAAALSQSNCGADFAQRLTSAASGRVGPPRTLSAAGVAVITGVLLLYFS